MMATMMSAVPLPIFANGVTSLHTLRSAQQDIKGIVENQGMGTYTERGCKNSS